MINLLAALSAVVVIQLALHKAAAGALVAYAVSVGSGILVLYVLERRTIASNRERRK
jgi:hypothetical protein